MVTSTSRGSHTNFIRDVLFTIETGHSHRTPLKPDINRPQHSCGKVIFSQASVILSTGRYPLGRHPQANPPALCMLGYMRPQCCNIGQNDTIGKIELKQAFVLSSGNTNSKNDIQ